MPFIDPNEDFLHFAGAEAFIEDIPMNGGAERYLKFRFHAVNLTDDTKPVDMPWLFIPIEAVEQLSAQLAAMAESAKRWVPGEKFETVGENIGVMNTTELTAARETETEAAAADKPDYLTSHPKGHRWPL